MLRLLKKDSFEVVRTIQDVREAKVKHDLYDNFDLEFKSSENLSLWDRLETYIQGKAEYFYITRCKKELEKNVYYAKHISELLRYKIEDFTITQGEFSKVKEKVGQMLTSHGFAFEVFGKSDVRATFNEYNTSVLELLDAGERSVRGIWGGFFLREGLKIKWYFDDVKKTDVLIARRKNIVDYLDESNLKDFATRLKVRNSFSAVNDTDVDSDDQMLFTVVDSPLINEYPVIIEQAINLNMEEYDTVEKLKLYANRMFKHGKDKPKTHFSFTPSSEIMEQGLCIGGSALIYYEHQGIYDSVRLTSYEYDPMNQKFTSLGFGEAPRTLENVIRRQINRETKPMRHSMEKMESKQKKQKKAIKKQQADLRQQAEVFNSKISKTMDLVDGAKAELSTQIHQTAEKIELTASKVGQNERSIANLAIRADSIVSEVGEVRMVAGQAVTVASRVEQTADRLAVSFRQHGRIIERFRLNGNGLVITNLLVDGSFVAYNGKIPSLNSSYAYIDSADIGTLNVRNSGKDHVPGG